jgi:hypothetical protein
MNYHNTKKSSHTKAIGIALVLVASFIACDYFLNNSAFAQANPVANTTAANPTNNPLLTTATDTSSPFSPVDLALLAKIESIKLDDSFLKNPVFMSLRDWTVELGHEDAGRPNPFIPIDGAVVPAAKNPAVKPVIPAAAH